ncbi:MAG: hypothetical protein IT514_02780 [Burkholderiales bacterium]|nr:hypothetical protein [Burkholderiales bacterium]
MSAAIFRWLEATRRASASLALIAALFVLAQPVCAAFEAPSPTLHGGTVLLSGDAPTSGGQDAEPCCPAPEASAPPAPAPSAAHSTPSAQGAAFRVREPTTQLTLHAPSPLPGGPPGIVLSYFARTARIQR